MNSLILRRAESHGKAAPQAGHAKHTEQFYQSVCPTVSFAAGST